MLYKGCTCGQNKIDCVDCMKNYISSMNVLAGKIKYRVNEIYEISSIDKDKNVQDTAIEWHADKLRKLLS